ncbi:hypothetical protein [Christiangramia sediminis]|uniref:Uncharacterized protein n=1 Tax=Christiangramia sediminis TaxID=2881336 RepID=A0A9X1RUB5_9FLAO|nr:hypothetical protein [Christiangramia sediminis]MCB7480513.1 hypothetical protein [Christiangramia sediminis]
MKKFILVLFVVAFGLESTSQEQGVTGSDLLIDYTKYIDYENNQNSKYILGSIYLNDDFVEGKIINTETNEFQLAFLRYNALEDLVEIKLTKDSKIQVLPKVDNLEYHFEDHSIVFNEIETTKGDVINGYFIEYFSKDDLVFVAKPILTGKEERFSIHDDNLKLFLDYDYYVQKKENVEEVRLAKSNFEKYFSDKDKMEPYFKNNKIKNESDVVAMLQFYAQ